MDHVWYLMPHHETVVSTFRTQGVSHVFFWVFFLFHHEAAVPSPSGTPNAPPEHFPQLTSLELSSSLDPNLGEEVILYRLCYLLALKLTYIKAIGQPIGLDWSCISSSNGL